MLSLLTMLERLVIVCVVGVFSTGSFVGLGASFDATIGGTTTAAVTPSLGSSRQAAIVSSLRHAADVLDAVAGHVVMAADDLPVPFRVDSTLGSFRRQAANGLYVPDQGSGFDVVRHAFGSDNNPIQFSMELEGVEPRGVIDFYHPNAIDEADWLAMSTRERYSFIQNKKYNRWGSWNRMSTAPDWMRERLATEGRGDVWEITTATYTDTLDETWSHVNFLEDATGAGGFHYHTTFMPEPGLAAEVATYLAHIDELHSTAMFDWDPRSQVARLARAQNTADDKLRDNILFSNVGHRYLRPQLAGNIEKIESAISEGNTTTHKLYAVGFRSGSTYGNTGRVGYEFRAVGGNRTKNRLFLERTVEFLENPYETNLALLDGTPSFRIEDLIGLDRLSPATIKRIAGADLAQTLEEIAKSGNSSGASRINFRTVTWGYPMLKWEERPHLLQLERQIKQARERFVNEVGAIAEEFKNAGARAEKNREFADRVNYAVETFVHESGIARSY